MVGVVVNVLVVVVENLMLRVVCAAARGTLRPAARAETCVVSVRMEMTESRENFILDWMMAGLMMVYRVCSLDRTVMRVIAW